jgi:hypothetical protein
MSDGEEKDKDKDLEDVMAEEQSRGSRRRPIDTETRRKMQRLREELQRALRVGDEGAFLKALRDAGLREESPEFARALQLFRTVSRRL